MVWSKTHPELDKEIDVFQQYQNTFVHHRCVHCRKYSPFISSLNLVALFLNALNICAENWCKCKCSWQTTMTDFSCSCIYDNMFYLVILHDCALFWPLSHFQEESPLSVSSPDSIGTWLHYTCGVGTGRRRRRSGDQITSSPVSPKSLAFTSSIFGSWQQVFTPFNSLPSHTKKNKADSSFVHLCLRRLKLSQGPLISRSM